MSKRNLPEWYDELSEDTVGEVSSALRRRKRKHIENIRVEQFQERQGDEGFSFTYQASLFEHTWLLNSLGAFYMDRWIVDVLRMVKAGKEASVYLCQGAESTGSELVAAKVYRPRMLRNLKKDFLYREGRTKLDIEGREIHDSGQLHAMRMKTRYGQELSHTSWIGHEFTTLKLLFQAGADVPRPFASDSKSILMAYIGENGVPAQALSDIRLDAEEVQPLFERSVRNIEIMLANQRVHGDLSAYNILYWDGQITLIDFPQAIHPEQNKSAYRIFERDVTRTCEYFARQKPKGWSRKRGSLNPHYPKELAADLWTSYRYRIQPEVDPALLDAEDEGDAEFWKHMQDEGSETK